MATLNEYRSKFRLLGKQEVIAEWRELFESINGNAFFFKVVARRISKNVLGKPIQTNAVLFGEWLCPAADYSLDTPFTKLATNQGGKTSTTTGLYFEQC